MQCICICVFHQLNRLEVKNVNSATSDFQSAPLVAVQLMFFFSDEGNNLYQITKRAVKQYSQEYQKAKATILGRYLLAKRKTIETLGLEVVFQCLLCILVYIKNEIAKQN